jgi:hypothetical protein
MNNSYELVFRFGGKTSVINKKLGMSVLRKDKLDSAIINKHKNDAKTSKAVRAAPDQLALRSHANDLLFIF